MVSVGRKGLGVDEMEEEHRTVRADRQVADPGLDG